MCRQNTGSPGAVPVCSHFLQKWCYRWKQRVEPACMAFKTSSYHACWYIGASMPLTKILAYALCPVKALPYSDNLHFPYSSILTINKILGARKRYHRLMLTEHVLTPWYIKSMWYHKYHPLLTWPSRRSRPMQTSEGKISLKSLLCHEGGTFMTIYSKLNCNYISQWSSSEINSINIRKKWLE